MMGKVYSACVHGIMAELIEVEADVTAGIPNFELTGNLSGIVKEAKDRVRMAIKNSGIKLNPARIVINLAPANIRKEGPHFDLAMAIGVLCAVGVLDNESVKDTMFVGELGLDGRVNPVNAVLPMIDCAATNNIRRCIVPAKNAGEGALLSGIDVIGVNTLNECINYIGGMVDIPAVKSVADSREMINVRGEDFSDIRGQEGLKRALLIATAAMHNVLMVGPPGAGKTMAASRIVSIMPPMTRAQMIEVSRIYSVAGLLSENGFWVKERPFRAPNYTITSTAMAGGGYNPIPGEMSLAEHGVLFLDELNLFKPEVVETLRIPLESGCVKVNRLHGIYEYPADFMLVAAINPCRCGFYPDITKCNCTERDIARHFGKISRPILDRIDMCVQAPKVSYENIERNNFSEKYSGEKMRRDVLKIHEIQNDRFKNFPYKYNSKIPVNKIDDFCPMEDDAKTLIKTVYEKYDLTARSYHKIMKVARTIADLEGHERIMLSDIGEATGYRIMEAKNE